MHRLLAVTTGYLKYTLMCMVGGAILFSLAGLEMTAPKAFLVVMIVAIGASLVVRADLNIRRRSGLAAKRYRENPDADEGWAELLSMSQGLTAGLAAAYAPVALLSHHSKTIKAPSNIQSLLVSQWNLNRNLRTQSNDKEVGGEAETRLVMRHLKARENDLLRIGVYPLFVSKAPSQEIIRMMHSDKSARGWGNVIVTHHGSGAQEEYGSPRMVSIVFVSTVARSWPTQLDTILKDVLRIDRGDVLEVTES
jgi:hypothetical protein